MGSGSSRSGRALRRLRGSDSRPAGSCGVAPQARSPAAAAPEEAPAVAAEEEASGRDPGPAAAPDGREETLRLLDQLLAESEAWVPGAPEPALPGPARCRPAARVCRPVSPQKSAEDLPASSTMLETPDSRQGRPDWPAVTYDRAEQELMASIEREYCR